MIKIFNIYIFILSINGFKFQNQILQIILVPQGMCKLFMKKIRPAIETTIQKILKKVFF